MVEHEAEWGWGQSGIARLSLHAPIPNTASRCCYNGGGGGGGGGKSGH